MSRVSPIILSLPGARYTVTVHRHALYLGVTIDSLDGTPVKEWDMGEGVVRGRPYQLAFYTQGLLEAPQTGLQVAPVHHALADDIAISIWQTSRGDLRLDVTRQPVALMRMFRRPQGKLGWHTLLAYMTR